VIVERRDTLELSNKRTVLSQMYRAVYIVLYDATRAALRVSTQERLKETYTLSQDTQNHNFN
jgi:hypothetical protein